MITEQFEADGFPSHDAYAWHHRCSRCGAEPGEPCTAPRQWASHDRINRDRERFGQLPLPEKPYGFMHAPRIDAGYRHRSRDIGKAPWSEDRIPGRQYDTLPRPLLPAKPHPDRR